MAKRPALSFILQSLLVILQGDIPFTVYNGTSRTYCIKILHDNKQSAQLKFYGIWSSVHLCLAFGNMTTPTTGPTAQFGWRKIRSSAKGYIATYRPSARNNSNISTFELTLSSLNSVNEAMEKSFCCLDVQIEEHLYHLPYDLLPDELLLHQHMPS